jgi:putative spermidine/putrescine transport system substrate-binding protein
VIASVAVVASACGGSAATQPPSAGPASVAPASHGATAAASAASHAPTAVVSSAATSTAAATASTLATLGPPSALATASALASQTASNAPLPSGVPTSLGEGEGQLTVLSWPGYVENGSTDPKVDWVTPFQKDTGCKVTNQIFGTSDEAFSLFSTNPGKYDVISASGDASLRLVRAGYVQPINVDLIPNYADIFEALKNRPYNTVDGVHYGVPHGRGANLLMWRTDLVTPAPTSWDQMLAPNSGYKVSVYDAPIYIADAAVVLMSTHPELGITNPYALDATQFKAATDLLQAARPNMTDFWTDYTKQMQVFTNGDANVGTTWQIITNLLQAASPAVPVQAIKPAEGATGWSDTWMINSKTQHINCAYKFINWIVSPQTNANIAEWFGEAPANSKSCTLTSDPNFCATFHAQEDSYWQNVWYWQTPEAQCVDGRTDTTCMDFGQWVDAWQQIKG